jgi:hypothetical protein
VRDELYLWIDRVELAQRAVPVRVKVVGFGITAGVGRELIERQLK